MQRVFVQTASGQPVMPCHPARARRLLHQGRARVIRRQPFTIAMRDRDGGAVQPLRLKFDPGSRTTGMAIIAEGARGQRVVWAAQLTHRAQQIRQRLADRRALRRARRWRKCRNRRPRFNNRRRPAGWLPPSLQSRVDNTTAWARRLMARAPVAAIDVETTRFDTHVLAAGRALSGVEYQRGTLHGTEAREYLLHCHGHTCAYCRGLSGDRALEIEHVRPRAQGGTDRIANLVIACTACNQRKGRRTAGEWSQAETGRSRLAQCRRSNSARIGTGHRPVLRDAAALNASRYAVGRRLQGLGVAVAFSSGGRTKFNRQAQGYPKAHWIDAACVGESGAAVRLDPAGEITAIAAAGRGSRQVCKPDRFGFPRTRAGRCKRVDGLQTGDTVSLVQPSGRYRGRHIGPLAGVRADGRVDVRTRGGKITGRSTNVRLLARFDGYRHNPARAD